MNLTRHVELPLPGPLGTEDTCSIWIYDNVLSESKTLAFSHIINQSVDGYTRLNYESRMFNIEGQLIKLVGTADRHNYIKIWSIVDYKDYFYQTNDTVHEWCHDVLSRDLHPALRYLVTAIEQEAQPFVGRKAIPLRFFVNVFPAGEPMEPHVDGNRYEIPLDMDHCNLWSATYYLQVPEVGGELWFRDSDFRYKPEANTMAIFNGNKFIHGVRSGPHTNKDRVSITVRYALIDDLILPGHPDKWLYKPDLEQLTK